MIYLLTAIRLPLGDSKPSLFVATAVSSAQDTQVHPSGRILRFPCRTSVLAVSKATVNALFARTARPWKQVSH